MADIVRYAGQSFIERSRRWINGQHEKVLLAITRCRTAALGGHRDQCSGCGGLKVAFHEGKIEFHGHLASLAEPRSFAAWLRLLFLHHWVVYSKPPFAGPEHALRYLGAYTHRVGIANSRLVAFSEGFVSFRWRDSAHGNKKRVMRLPVDEFLRRFLLHLLPRGFVRIRNFGFLANRQRTRLLPLCFTLLQS